MNDLLNPRYEAIALYPNCFFEIGDVFKKVIDNYDVPIFNIERKKDVILYQEQLEKYPHLFKKLE